MMVIPDERGGNSRRWLYNFMTTGAAFVAIVGRHQEGASSPGGRTTITKSISVLAAAALAIAGFALTPNRAAAQSYSGNWPINWDVTYPQEFANTYTFCLKLTDNGSVGFPHSGPATLTSTGNPNVTGVFQVINGEFVATFLEGSDTGELDTQIFVAPASKGVIGNGFGEESSITITGTADFGKKNSCSTSN
jgi:hypothetical protein